MESEGEMLTPQFRLSQTHDELIVVIRAPYANVAETEVEFLSHEILFSSKPYFLRLYLKNEINEAAVSESTDYDAEKGEFTIRAKKATAGEHFVGLDLVTELLTSPGRSTTRPLVEIVGDDDDKEENGNDDIQFLHEQKVQNGSQPKSSNGRYAYGFAQKAVDAIEKLQDEMQLVMDIRQPSTHKYEERAAFDYELCAEAFDPYRFYTDENQPNEALQSVLNWNNRLFNGDSEWASDEFDRLKELPRVNHNGKDSIAVRAGLVDILYAVCYDARVTQGELNCESSWTICKLAATFCCARVYSSIGEAVENALRRAMCFPMHRSWKLAQKVLDDVRGVLSTGRRSILRALLYAQKALNKSGGEYRYVFNELYVNDYCVWVQQCSDETLTSLSRQVAELKFERKDVKLDLDEFEMEAGMEMTSV